MSQGASPYPVQRFLRRLIAPFASSRSEFVQALGYRDLEVGRRHLDSWLDRGEGYDRIIAQIAAAYPDHAGELEKAIAETAEIKAAEGDPGWLERCKTEEASFLPYIHVQGEQSVPSGITLFGISGGHERWTTIHIPGAILKLPVEEQLAMLPKLMLKYRRRYKGACPFFGRVAGFKFVRCFDYFQFDQDGGYIEHVEKPFRRGTCSVELR